MVAAYLLRLMLNLKNSLNKELINRKIEERLCVIYKQKDIFSSKQYEQLKNNLVFYYCRLNYQI